MKTIRRIAPLTVLLISLHCASQETALTRVEQMSLANVIYLCEWAKINAPKGNPVLIRACDPDAKPDVRQAEIDSQEWWQHWLSEDGDAWSRLNESWNIALEAKIQRDSAREIAQEKKDRLAHATAEKENLIRSLRTMSVPALCRVIREHNVPEAQEELVNRSAFSTSETALIRGRRIILGMTEAAMYCALGTPKRSNRSVGSWGVHIQHVYDELIVYTEDGKVTSWQD